MDTIVNYVFEALHSGELKPYYQAQFNADRKIIGGESLVRWVKKDGTIIPPLYFIRRVEVTPMINAIDWYVLEQVMRMMSQNREKFAGRNIAVNFSHWHIEEDNCIKRLQDFAKLFQVEPEQISIEISEDAFHRQYDRVGEWVKGVRDAGFVAAVDDFGAGILQKDMLDGIPISGVKFGHSMLAENVIDGKGSEQMDKFLQDAADQGLAIAVEGVETEEQFAYFKSKKVQEYQGFLFSRAVTEEEFLKML